MNRFLRLELDDQLPEPDIKKSTSVQFLPPTVVGPIWTGLYTKEARGECPQTEIILPGRSHGSYEYPDLLVETARSYTGRNWFQCHEELARQDALMLTMRQFVDFLNLLRSDTVYDVHGARMDKAAVKAVLDDILGRDTPLRGEWVNACFTRNSGTDQMNLTYVDTAGSVTQTLEEYLVRNSPPQGYSCVSWLQNATVQGLPSPNVALAGSITDHISYWQPVEGRVASFVATPFWVGLTCRTGQDGMLGVRVARIRN